MPALPPGISSIVLHWKNMKNSKTPKKEKGKGNLEVTRNKINAIWWRGKGAESKYRCKVWGVRNV